MPSKLKTGAIQFEPFETEDLIRFRQSRTFL